ncbi:Malonyl CoA-acyl carrier protein transacylase, partial [Phytophthora palmivora]
AVWNVDVDLQWLRYGSLTDFNEWSADVLHPSHPVDLVLMLVRLSDLEAAHPELHLTQKSDESVTAEAADSPINQFLRGLEQYDAISTAAPLVILLCPCPPVTAARFDAMERKMQSKVDAMRNVTVQSSNLPVGLFEQQFTAAFYDAIADKRQHSPYTQSMLNVLSLSLCRQICRLFRTASSRKKVIVLDCDNTLWGGAVAEVGPYGIDLAPRFLALQRFVVAQQQRGMLLALCSKNVFKDVREAFTRRRGDMIIDMDQHVVATKVNWQPKSENIAQLSKELSIGLDSFIFIDDNPLECNEVETALPTVTVISLGEDFPESLLDHEWVFDDGLKVSSRGSTTHATTTEDHLRTQFYQQNLVREQLRESSSTHKAFLSALGVKIVFEEFNREQGLEKRSASLTRALQLHHRTNQFNTATTFAKRMEEVALLDYVDAPDHTVICAHVTDRFGHYGLVCVALCQLERVTNVLRVDSFLLSCRALNRGVEHAMMRRLSEIAERTGALSLEFAWEPTERNQPAYAFFSALSDVIFAPKHYHQCKEQLRISTAGSWAITTDKARMVSFLKADNSPQSKVKAVRWILQLRSGQWLRDLAFSVITWMLSSTILPSWITQLLKPSVARRLGGVRSAGLLRVPLRDRGSLEHFLSPALRDVPSVNNIVAKNADTNDDDKFRRKARHQTKLALVNHLHEEAPRLHLVTVSTLLPAAPQQSNEVVNVPFSDAATVAIGSRGS